MSEVAAAAAAGASVAPETRPGARGALRPRRPRARDRPGRRRRPRADARLDGRRGPGRHLETGDVHFHSRSRDRLWRKGETSGNVLRLIDLAVDCDGDALLVTADPVGPTCHRGTRSCFDPGRRARRAHDAGVRLARDALVHDRSPGPTERPAGSYTTSLLDGGVDAVGRKVTEEATELLLAAKDDADRLDDRRPAKPWPARPPTCSTTPWSCSRSETCRRPPSSTRSAPPRAASGAGRRAQPARRPISRRRLPIRTSSHSPAMGSGTNAGSDTRVPVDRHAPAGDRPSRLAPRREDARLRQERRGAIASVAGSNVNPPVDSNSDRSTARDRRSARPRTSPPNRGSPRPRRPRRAFAP